MESNVTINVTNQTLKTRRLALYAIDRNRDAVALCRIEVEPGKQLESPPIDFTPSAVLGERRNWEVGSIYEALVHEEAKPGSKWKVTGGPGEAKLEPDGELEEGANITITNETDGNISAGLGFGEKGAIYQRVLKNRESVSIDMGFGFNIALFETIREGAVIYPSLAMEPVKIESMERGGRIMITVVKNVETLELKVKSERVGATPGGSKDRPDSEEKKDPLEDKTDDSMEKTKRSAPAAAAESKAPQKSSQRSRTLKAGKDGVHSPVYSFPTSSSGGAHPPPSFFKWGAAAI